MAIKDDTIAELRKLVEKQSEQIAALTNEVAQLKLQLAKAAKDSSNSSKPPSSDFVNSTKQKQKNKPGRPRKKRVGGQPGHKRQLREPLLPDSPIYVTEHRLRLYESPDGSIYFPHVPELCGQPIFGARLLATIGWMKSQAHCSYTTIEEYFDDVLKVPVSRGYLSKVCTGVISGSLADAYEEVRRAIPQQPQLGSDETSFKNNGRKNWVWCISSAVLTVFHIATSRSRAVLEELVGDEFVGHMNFDYFSANCSFAWNYAIKAQYCWAHLIRDIRFLIEYPDRKTRVWAEQLLDRSRRLFSAWYRRDEMSETGLYRSLVTHRDRLLDIIRNPPNSREARYLAARFAIVDVTNGSTYDLSQDYVRFLFIDGLEPTNNQSEQQIRQVVIDRRITQGTRSESGQRYHERMWTAIATCKKQNKNFFEFLHASIVAKLQNRPAPSLIA